MAYPQYTPYQPTWTGQYLHWPSMGQTLTTLPYTQQPQNGIVKVNGRDSMGRYTSRRGYEPDHRMPM